MIQISNYYKNKKTKMALKDLREKIDIKNLTLTEIFDILNSRQRYKVDEDREYEY